MTDPNDKWKAAEVFYAGDLARRALREAIRIPETIATIIDFGPMSDVNAAVTLRQAYAKLHAIGQFLDSLPRPPGFDEGN